MANHGAGNKFVSVNLNKSYGKLSGPSNSSLNGASRIRSGNQAGGGGGIVVLSRPRSSQKTGQKLSVPSPVNLPSMRKEHERFDLSGAGTGSAGGAAGSSSRPSSAGMGWTKPAAIVLQEKDKSTEIPSDFGGGTFSNSYAASKGGSVYMPPAISGSANDIVGPAQVQAYTSVEKVAILRGEDFPSLHTSLSTDSGNTHKQKDGGNKKSKLLPGEDLSNNRRDNTNIGDVDMRTQGQKAQQNLGYGSSGNDVGGQRLGGPRSTEDAQKQESYFHGSLPEVRLNSRSDWADDERDTGHVLTDRCRNHISQKNEGHWERDFDTARGMPPKPAPNVFNKWGQRGGETGKVLSSEVFKTDLYNRDARPTSKEGRDRNSWNNSESHGREGRDINSWRNSSTSVIKANPRGPMNSGNDFDAELYNRTREMSNDYRFLAPFSDAHDRVKIVSDLGSSDRKNLNSFEGGRQTWNNTVEPTRIKEADRVVRDQFGGDQFQRHRSNNYQNVSPAKSTFSLGGKGLPVNDPVLNFSKVKKPLAKSEELSLEDPFAANGFDGRDPFSGGLMGVVKRKKDVPKLAEFNDPARESFEAELERVQQMQEQERQCVIEEQQRAMLLARREEDEKLRLAEEQAERQRKLEEEAREAAWRAEQEQLQAVQRAEEQRMAREEEKQRMQMEEERRKQAAKQKLLELEEKIARRQAEATKEDTAYAVDGISGPGKEIETSRAADISDWEDGERMVERITTSASSDSSGLNRFVDSGSRCHSFADSSVLPGRGKSFNLWKRDAYESEGSSNFILHNQDSGHNHDSPGRDIPFPAKKSLSRKDAHGGSGFMYPQNYANAGVLDPEMNFHLRRERWNFAGEKDHYDTNPENDREAHIDGGWGGRSASHHAHSIYQERPYHDPELGEVCSNSRSRYSIRQPRVLPPPSVSSVNRTLNRGDVEQPGLSTSLDRIADGNYVRDHAMQTGFDSVLQEQVEDPEMVSFHPGDAATRNQLLEGNHSIRCDSQSSLSVTSPPSSPTHLSHEDMEDSRSTPDSSDATEVKAVRPSSGDPVIKNRSFLIAADDGEWIVENRENLQEQEVYDEGGEYQEGDEVHAEDEDIDLNEEFEALNLEEKDSPRVSENLILGFNEGIEVGMPSEGSEGNQNENSKFTLPQSVNNANSVQSDGQVRARSSTEMQLTEEWTGDLVVQSNVTPPMSLGCAEVTVSSSQPLPAFAAPFPVSQMVTSSMPTDPNRPDVPVLQFGLFSGPSLIQSPVPAIQIGSIQLPLHVHPPVGSSLPHQSGPLFQFGQLRYNSPILQGLMPLVPQTVSFVQPSVPGPFANHNPAGPTSDQPVQHSSQSQNTNNREDLATNQESLSKANRNLTMDSNSLQCRGEEGKNVVIGGPSSNRNTTENDNRLGLEVKVNGHLQYPSAPNDPISSTGEGQLLSRVIPPHQLSRERVMIRSKATGPESGSRGRESFVNVKSFGPRSPNFASVAPHMESSKPYRKPQRNGQRGEYQVQENADRRLQYYDDKMNFGPRGARMSSRNGSRKGAFLGKLAKQTNESDWPVSGPVSTKDITSGSKADKNIPDESSIIGHPITRSGEGRLKRNVEEDIDVPLQTGFVYIYEQPGIEVPSDEDDFIEVRSKRQMLNDRREQREKDNKAKSRLAKNLQKPRPSSQNTQAPHNVYKISRSLGRTQPNEGQPNFVAPEGRSRVNDEAPAAGFNTISVSQPLAPIGTPSTHSDGHFETRSLAIMPGEVSGLPVLSTDGKSVGQGLAYENKNSTIENVEGSLSHWNNAWVMPLTQSQLDDAMSPVRFEAHGSSGSIGLPVPSSSNSMKDKFSSSTSPINSLLAGKKIQFGAVTSPTILPHSSRVVSQGIGSGRSEQGSHGLSASENVCSLFNEREKHPKELSTHIEVSESEAAASAVAVASITTDDILGTRSGHSVSVSDSKGSEHAAVDGIDNYQKSMSQSRSEGSLSLSLPADLSVEASPVSPWQPLQSPQIASNHMLSHFPGGHPSHFPFFEMNPMVGGPIFAFGPHDDASGSQKNNTAESGPVAPWQQHHHAGADSFYGHPAGYAAPFISQTGGITGAQGHPHMVVYNHFAAVGQFGQVGLSFMGTTYIPSGKQPDWKHNPTSSAMIVGEDNVNNMGMNSGQHVPHSIPAPIQHLAPGPSLLPMAPPLAMFDVSSYHQSSDMAGPTRWSHHPPPHLQSMPSLLPLPLPLPLQSQPESLMHSQLSNGPPTPALINRFPDSQKNYPVISSGPASQFSAESCLNEQSSSSPSALKEVSDAAPDAGKIGASQSSSSSSSQYINSSVKYQRHEQKHSRSSTGYNSQRGGGGGGGGSSQRNVYRGSGYHSRNQSEKGFHPSKVKQMYVPKQQPAATSGTS